MIFVWLMFILWFSQVYSFDRWVPEAKPIPKDFLFGASTAAFEVEGGRHDHGRNDSIWDIYFEKLLSRKGVDWETAADSINNVERDVMMLRKLGVDFYKFSISWSRILPSGYANKINEDAVAYYEKLLNLLLKYNIEPMVVMYNTDLPQSLQNLGGWANPESVRWFCDYTKILLKRFNSKVRYWITLNDPSSCFDGYGGSVMPPFVNIQGVADYLCIKHMLLAHGKVYRYFEKKFKPKAKNEMGMAMTINAFLLMHKNNKNGFTTKENTQLERLREMAYDVILHPIFSKEGDFPSNIKNLVNSKSAKEGYPRSRLPAFTSQEVSMLLGAADFLGVNHVKTRVVMRVRDRKSPFPYPDACCLKFSQEVQELAQAQTYPYGLYYGWFSIQKLYGHNPMFITELGWSMEKGLRDDNRVENIKRFMMALLYAIYDGAKIRGIAFRSLMDGIETTTGTELRYGLFETDFDSPKKECKPRASAVYLRHLIEQRIVKEEYDIPEEIKLDISTRRTDIMSKKIDDEKEDEDLMTAKQTINNEPALKDDQPALKPVHVDEETEDQVCKDEL